MLLLKCHLFYPHFTFLQNGIQLKPPDVNVACDWLSWWTPTLHQLFDSFDLLEVGLICVHLGAKRTCIFMWLVKKERLDASWVKPVTIKNVPLVLC